MDWLSIFSVLNPHGPIGLAERGLIVNATLLMLIVILPVLGLLFFFAWWYRAGNTKAQYAPNWEHGKMEELIWWAIPLEIVLVLGALTWSSTHALDPRMPIGLEEPMIVQVVALDWKWLFIYPEEGVASVSEVALPVGRPVRFEITADAPMNSFWIPELGGQIYAMTGMVNELNLMASKEGAFKGLSANYSGEGFAQMKFMARALSQEDFDAWIGRAKASSKGLDGRTYNLLALPGVAPEPSYYGAVDADLFKNIVASFTQSMTSHMH